MEVVNTLDIDGIQWKLQDEEARNKIATLEMKTTVKVTNKIKNKNIIMNLIEINNEKFLQLHIEALYWSGAISEIIATFINDFGLTVILRCMVEIDFNDGSGRNALSLDIGYDGNIRAYPMVEDKIIGMYKAAYINGDAFIRVKV